MRRLRQDLRAFIGKVLIDNVFGFRLAIHDASRGLGPIVAFFPGRPVPLRIKTVQLVRASADIGVEGKLGRVCLFLEDVLREDPGAAPAVEEGSVEAGVWLL